MNDPLCLHCERRPSAGRPGLCAACHARSCIRVLCVVRRHGWTPAWEAHLRRLTERAKQKQPLFEEAPADDDRGTLCLSPASVMDYHEEEINPTAVDVMALDAGIPDSPANPLEGNPRAAGAPTNPEAEEVGAKPPVAKSGGKPGDIHRIGGASVENLRLKPREAALELPGISVIKAPTPGEAAQEMRAGLPRAKGLHEQAKTIGTTSQEAIRGVGFDVIPTPSTVLPNHHRIIHPEGAAGFSDANLVRLAEVFVNTMGH